MAHEIHNFLVVCQDCLTDLGRVRPVLTERRCGIHVYLRRYRALMVCEPGGTTFRESHTRVTPEDARRLFDTGRYRGLIMLGSNWPLRRCRLELDWFGQAVEMERAVLGICHGAQVISSWYGWSKQKPVDHQGFHPVIPAGEGAAGDPVLAPIREAMATDPGVVLGHSHFETWDAPEEHVLARSGPEWRDHVDAFRVGRLIYGLQFHPELDLDLLAEWRRGWELEGRSIRWPDESRLVTTMRVGREVIEAWVRLVVSPVVAHDPNN